MGGVFAAAGGFVLGCAAVLGAASPLLADGEDGLKDEVQALKRRVEEQDRRLREMSGSAMTRDEVTSAVDRYLASNPSPILVGGDEAAGSAGFPLGKHPFLKQGPNRLDIGLREQVRYESFLYSTDGVGTLKSPANTLSGEEPRDRSAFEVERMVLTFEGSVFCEDLTFQFQWNLDSDGGTGVEKRAEWLDWKYAGEHHVRAGNDKIPFGWEENTSSGALAFVDRNLASRAFSLGWDTGVSLWGRFGDCEHPKRFWYRAMVANGEGNGGQTNVFSADAFDTFSDQVLLAGALEWNITCRDWKWDEVDLRDCEGRNRLDASLGVSAYHENDDDASLSAPGGLAVKAPGPLERTGLNAWFRAQWRGWSFQSEWFSRHVSFTRGSASPDQDDSGFYAQLHHRFGDSPWGLGAKYAVVWADDDTYDSAVVGGSPVDLDPTMSEFGVVVNYFFWDHLNKLSLDASWVRENSGVSSSSTGYLVDPAKGVVVEDGLLLRLQWQISL